MVEVKPNVIVDARGELCPMPVVKVSKGLKEIQVGQVIEAITTDPGALSDFPAWARISGNEILKTDQGDGVIKIYIKRTK